MKNLYQNIFNQLENNLKDNYQTQCQFIKSNIFDNIQVDNHFYNERTIASYSTNIFEKMLIEKCVPYGVINEARFKLLKKMNDTAKKKLKKEVSDLSDKNYDDYLEPDAVISFCSNGIDYNFFIEYKVHHKYFKYIQLANDYLKYKIYTSISTINTKFVYIIFNTKNNMPTLLTGENNTPIIQFIDKTISKASINKYANIFIYDTEISKEDSNSNLNYYVGIKEIKILDKIVKNAEKLTYANCEDFKNIEDYSNNEFVKNISKLGSKVSTAKVILKNYKGIEELYHHLNIQKYSLIDSANMLCKDKKIENLDQLFNWMADYSDNIDLFKDKIGNSNSILSKQIKRRSMFVMLFLEKYCIDNHLECIKLVPKNKREAKDLNDIRNSQKYKEWYTKDYSKSKFDTLVRSIVYFLYNLQSVIYKIDGDKIVFNEYDEPVYNEKYNNYLLKSSIVENLRKIKTSFGKNNNFKVDWNVDLEDFGKSLLEILIHNDFENLD